MLLNATKSSEKESSCGIENGEFECRESKWYYEVTSAKVNSGRESKESIPSMLIFGSRAAQRALVESRETSGQRGNQEEETVRVKFSNN